MEHFSSVWEQREGCWHCSKAPDPRAAWACEQLWKLFPNSQSAHFCCFHQQQWVWSTFLQQRNQALLQIYCFKGWDSSSSWSSAESQESSLCWWKFWSLWSFLTCERCVSSRFPCVSQMGMREWGFVKESQTWIRDSWCCCYFSVHVGFFSVKKQLFLSEFFGTVSPHVYWAACQQQLQISDRHVRWAGDGVGNSMCGCMI